jgi:hypothetical protein
MNTGPSRVRLSRKSGHDPRDVNPKDYSIWK